MNGRGEARALWLLCVLWLISQLVTACRFQHENHPDHHRVVRRQIICDRKSRYRSHDGRCNNLKSPNLGIAGSTFRRILPPKYENNDGRTPRLTGVTGAKLPSPRLVSVTVHDPENHTVVDATMMFMQWGQFLDHDLTLTPATMSSAPCCSANLVSSGVLHPDVKTGGPCFPIIVDSNDRLFGDLGCMEFTRSDPKLDTNNIRQQYNALTPWIDGSQIYGHTDELARSLRSFVNGNLKCVTIKGEEFLPADAAATNETCFKLEPGDYCFKAGDVRVHAYAGLSALHTIFLRYHNKICDRLRKIHSDWSDETLYQEARRIVIAVLQRITYDDFMVQMLGQVASSYGLLFGNYTYNSSIDPTLSNVFSTAAYRFGHSLVSDSLTINGQIVETRDLFMRPKFVLNTLKNLIEALLTENSQRSDRWFTKGMTDRMFEKPNRPKTGQDIVSRNIQRGRDHGLPPYNDWLAFFGLPTKTFDTMEKGQLRYREVYSSVDDIDLYSGAISEFPVNGGSVGELFSRILANQFRGLKFGDRFWFENLGDVSSFTSNQVQQIARIKLSKVICDTVTGTSGIKKIQTNAFRPVSSTNPLTDCAALSDIDIERFWV